MVQWAKQGQTQLKMGAIVPFEHPKWSGIIVGKTHFGHIFDMCLVTKWPIFKAFWDLRWAKMARDGLKMGLFHLFVHPKSLGSLSTKRVFDPILTHLWSQNGPFSRHFGSFYGPKHVTMCSKWAKTACLSIASGPGKNFWGEITFFAPGTTMDLLLATTMRGPGCPLAPPNDRWYEGLGIWLDDSTATPPPPPEGVRNPVRRLS